MKQTAKRIAQVLFFVIFPTIALLLSCFYLSEFHVHKREASLGGYFVNSYYDNYGDKFYELTSNQKVLGHRCANSQEKVVLRKVYAFIIADEKLFVRSNDGDAVINSNGFCRLLPSETAPKIIGNNIYIMPSASALFPKDYQKLSLMSHHYNSYSTRGRDVVQAFGSGRFRIEKVTDTEEKPALALIDALQLERHTGRAIRLLSHVEEYEINGDSFVVRAKEGVAVFHNMGTKYALMYYDGGVFKNVYCAKDIKLMRSEKDFTVADRALFNSLKAAPIAS